MYRVSYEPRAIRIQTRGEYVYVIGYYTLGQQTLPPPASGGWREIKGILREGAQEHNKHRQNGRREKRPFEDGRLPTASVPQRATIPSLDGSWLCSIWNTDNSTQNKKQPCAWHTHAKEEAALGVVRSRRSTMLQPRGTPSTNRGPFGVIPTTANASSRGRSLHRPKRAQCGALVDNKTHVGAASQQSQLSIGALLRERGRSVATSANRVSCNWAGR